MFPYDTILCYISSFDSKQFDGLFPFSGDMDESCDAGINNCPRGAVCTDGVCGCPEGTSMSHGNGKGKKCS